MLFVRVELETDPFRQECSAIGTTCLWLVISLCQLIGSWYHPLLCAVRGLRSGSQRAPYTSQCAFSPLYTRIVQQPQETCVTG